MRYSASIEWECAHAGLIRIHPKPGGSAAARDPYVWSAFVARSGSVATIKGVTSPLPNAAVRPLRDQFYRHGIRSLVHERPGGRTVIHQLRPPRPEPMPESRGPDRPCPSTPEP